MKDERLIVEENKRAGRAIAGFIFAPLAAPLVYAAVNIVHHCFMGELCGRTNALTTLIGFMTFVVLISYYITIPSLTVGYIIIKILKLKAFIFYLLFSFIWAIAWSFSIYAAAGDFLSLLFLTFGLVGTINGAVFWLIERPDKP